jgi:hypothetical protein
VVVVNLAKGRSSVAVTAAVYCKVGMVNNSQHTSRGIGTRHSCLRCKEELKLEGKLTRPPPSSRRCASLNTQTNLHLHCFLYRDVGDDTVEIDSVGNTVSK